MKIYFHIFFTAFFILFFSRTGKSQNEKLNANVAVAAGYSGFYNNMFQFGLGFQPWDVEGSYVSFPLFGFTALYEYSPTRNLYGTSFNTLYLSGLFSCGLGFNRYAEFKNSTYGIKPMIGISIVRISFMFGYNFFLNENKIANFYHPSFNIGYYLPIWKRKDE